jgi:hypothetical protein
VSFRHPQSGRWSAIRRPVLCCANAARAALGGAMACPLGARILIFSRDGRSYGATSLAQWWAIILTAASLS